MLRYFKKKPRIAVLGLNPHNFEFKKNSEEFKIIRPVIKAFKSFVYFCKILDQYRTSVSKSIKSTQMCVKNNKVHNVLYCDCLCVYVRGH